jgi:hypothetical protein
MDTCGGRVMVKIFEANTKDEEFIMAFLRASDMEHVIRNVTLVPVEEYGSEGLMPLKGTCPEYPKTDISCMGSSGSNACGGYMGEVENFSKLVICAFGK